MINFSELRQENLFPNADQPALLYIAKAQSAKILDSFTYVSADWSETFKRHGIIEIGPENVKRIPVMRAANDPDALKVASWGGPRDIALIRRLREEPTSVSLGRLISRWGWPKPALGIQVSPKGTRTLDNTLPGKYLPVGEMPSFSFHSEDLESRADTIRVHYKPSRPEIYRGPLVLAVRGISGKGFYAATTADDVMYDNEYIGIPATGPQAHNRHLLNGILNSNLAKYFLFMTASSWGVERPIIGPIDLLRFPVPNPDSADSALLKDVYTVERQIALEGRTDALTQRLNSVVSDLYGLSATERVLVEDAVTLTIDQHMKQAASHAYLRPNREELEAYAVQCMYVMQPFFRVLNTHTMKASVLDVGSSPLSVVRFSLVPATSSQPDVQTISKQDIQDVMESIARELPDRVADRVYSRRDLRIYNGDDIFIIKPAQRRFWSRSAGLNDADLILAESMGVSNAAG